MDESDEKKVAELFADSPTQWGLRGDPYLWAEMSTHFAVVPLPSTEEELRALLAEAFERLTGQSLELDSFVKVERFKSHGMSSGVVCPEYWRTRAIPLLLERYAQT